VSKNNEAIQIHAKYETGPTHAQLAHMTRRRGYTTVLSGVLMQCVRFLFCWHVAHPLMYSVIHALAPGQKYSLFTHLIVSSLLGCLLRGPSCQVCMISRFSPWSGGMMRQCAEVSRQNGVPGLSTRSMGNVFSHSFMREWLLFWTMVMKCSMELRESSSATRMNRGLGSIIIYWLSFLPVSDPGGRDRASASKVLWTHVQCRGHSRLISSTSTAL
jgi:hypothetical protein